ncbi:MAG: alpha/beta fold hydrolase [Phycisphaerales bacterium]|jgi:uncharacterized protein|nr:alpha/beta fold hydrolase [Phycisphaerales bacterium]MBT7171734.1 alpha/beta fold hydrolase [Phycisphaerales bacterium]
MESFILATLCDWVSRNWALVAISATVLILVGVTCYFLAYYVRIILNIFCDTHPPLSRKVMDFDEIEGETIRFRSWDGTSLQGTLLGSQQEPYKGTILFSHEFHADGASCARYAKPLLDAGYQIFTFDYRAHGESSGKDYSPLQWPSDKEVGDLLGACAYMRSRLSDEGKDPSVGVFGISRGAGVALLAASSDSDIKAIVCDGAFDTQSTLISLMKRWGQLFAKIGILYKEHPEPYWRFLYRLLIHFAQRRLKRRFPSVAKALREMQPRPVYFIHGKRDSYIRVDQTESLHEMAPSPKYLWIVPKAKHNQAVATQPERYALRTVAFFDKHLAGLDIAPTDISPEDDPNTSACEVAHGTA